MFTGSQFSLGEAVLFFNSGSLVVFYNIIKNNLFSKNSLYKRILLCYNITDILRPPGLRLPAHFADFNGKGCFFMAYRTHNCNELTLSDLGKTVSLAGWVDTIRDHGGVAFIDLRDGYGVTQVVTAKSGATLGSVKVQPVWCLRPYRTFTEIDQPDSLFLLRLHSNGGETTYSLYETDGGAWAVTAMNLVREYLRSQFSDAVYADKIYVL